MNIIEVRKIVGQIKAQLFRKSNSFSIGMLKSHFRGSGLQFKEHRQYTHGDDVRFIDWKILAKTGDPFIKTFEEERNVQIAVVIDAGPSMLYGWNNVSKLQAALEITFMLYLLAAETNDFIHAIVLGEQIIDVPRGNGEKGITQLISTLSKHGILNDAGRLNLDPRSTYSTDDQKNFAIKKHLARNREVVVLSDWINFLDQVPGKKVLASKRSHCFRLLAPLDMGKGLPFTLKAMGDLSGQVGLSSFETRKDQAPFSISHRIKDLPIDERYLDLFVREMI